VHERESERAQCVHEAEGGEREDSDSEAPTWARRRRRLALGWRRRVGQELAGAPGLFRRHDEDELGAERLGRRGLARLDPGAQTEAELARPREGVRLAHAAAVILPGSNPPSIPRSGYNTLVRILVAEDETIIRLDLRELLERAGFDVCAEARDGVEAVELARSEQPDLAVLDVKMPRLDGIEAARRILDERPIPIVMLTAYGHDELVSRAVEAGVFGYLVKPFREADLLPAIRTARARHEELSAIRAEVDSLAEALAARKAIERAKGLLMEREGLTEQDAFARLRKASQISGRPLRVVAEALIATFAPD
jgi:AmiR/NasT family two-component response regulator